MPMETEKSNVSQAEEFKLLANEAFKGHHLFFCNLLIELLVNFLFNVHVLELLHPCDAYAF